MLSQLLAKLEFYLLTPALGRAISRLKEGEGRRGEQGAFQEGLIGGGDTQPWKRGGGGHCRELRAGGRRLEYKVRYQGG